MSQHRPRVALVIPAHGHAMLLPEAVRSALAQEAPFEIHTVIVNDGCPDPELHRVATALTRAHPGRLSYLRKANGGLSSARNAGIAHVLAHLPSVEALFMLDADNRLRPNAMARAMARLDRHPEAGWVYPSIDMFGIRARCDYGGPYARLIHAQMNVTEAGSLIRRAVFEAGVMFDETYLQGLEDWHFFLSAGDAGFRGVNEPEFGFFYRKRPESMLADADRDVASLFDRLRRDHPDLYRPRLQIGLEHDEAPRYALLSEGRLRLVTDPDHPGEEISQEGFVARYWRARTSPMQSRVPPFVVALGPGVEALLRRAGLLHMALWRLERAAMADEASYLTLAPARRAGSVGIDLEAADGATRRGTAAAWMIGAQVLRDLLAAPEPAAPHRADPQDLPARGPALRADLDTGPGMAAGPDLARLVAALHAAPVRQAGQRRWGWRQPSIGWRGKEHRLLRRGFDDQPVFPRRASGDRREIALLTDRADGPAARAALAHLAPRRAAGARLHLAVPGDETGAFPAGDIDGLMLFAEESLAARDPQNRHFENVPLLTQSGPGLLSAATAMLFWLDAVHVADCPAAHALAGPLRRLGVETVLHLQPQGPHAADDALTRALAYEHAYARLVVPAGLADYLHGRGVRRAKLEVRP